MNEAANKSYAACIEESLMTSTRMREVGNQDEADAWERHSNDWCLRAHVFLEGSYHSAALWGFLLGPIAVLWLAGGLVIGAVRRAVRGFVSIE